MSFPGFLQIFKVSQIFQLNMFRLQSGSGIFLLAPDSRRNFSLQLAPDALGSEKAHLFQNRKVAVVECGTWALQSGKKMIDILNAMKGIEIVNEKQVSILSNARGSVLSSLDELAENLVK